MSSAAQEAPIKISVVDDQEDFHVLLRDMAPASFQFKGFYVTAAQALAGIPRDKPDVVLMDIRLPDMSGIECTERLRTILPALPIVMLSGWVDRATLIECLLAGASGYLVKPLSKEAFVAAVKDVREGGTPLDKHVIPLLVQAFHNFRNSVFGQKLTRREREVLAGVFEGKQDKEIAATLKMGTGTVRTHMKRLFGRFGVHSRRELIAKFLDLH